MESKALQTDSIEWENVTGAFTCPVCDGEKARIRVSDYETRRNKAGREYRVGTARIECADEDCDAAGTVERCESGLVRHTGETHRSGGSRRAAHHFAIGQFMTASEYEEEIYDGAGRPSVDDVVLPAEWFDELAEWAA